MEKPQMLGAGVVVTCDRCNEPFDEESRVPCILPDCAHTYCSFCIQDIIEDTEEKKCPICQTPIGDDRQAEDFRINYKLLSLLLNPGTVQLSNIFPCGKHPDKPIEYFCKACSLAVCVKCIYDEHNGHNLVQVEEMSNTIKQNITDLLKMIMNSRRLTQDNLQLLEQARDELNKLLAQQIKNIEQGFQDLLRRLEEKKYEIVIDFEKQDSVWDNDQFSKYKREDQRLITIQNNLERNKEEIGSIEKIFMELINFVDQSSAAQILMKVQDVTSFLHKSFTDLENITKIQLQEKNDIYIQPGFRPQYLNTTKALDLIKKFEMIAAGNDQFNAFELKFLKQPNPMDKNDSGVPMSMMTSQQIKENFTLGQLGQKSSAKPPQQKRDVTNNETGGYEDDAENATQNSDQSTRGAGVGTGQTQNSRNHTNQGYQYVSYDDGDEDNPGQDNVKRLNNVIEQNRTQKFSQAEFNQANNLLTSAPKRKTQQNDQKFDAFDQITGKVQTNLKIGRQHMFDDQITDVIYLYGPRTDVYYFKLGTGEWENKALEKSSEFQGGIKSFSFCNIGQQKSFMTGGVMISTCMPLQVVYEFNGANMFQSIKKKNMISKRYGHCSLVIKGNVYILGGYGHKDAPGENTLTLSQCEKFNLSANNWENISNMNQGRVYFASCALDDQYAYIFGGIHDYQFLSNIEKYDAITDTWISLYFKLPAPLSKLAVIAYDKKNILIMGGMTADYEPQSSVYNLDINSAKFIKKASMRNERLLDGGVFYSRDGHIYAMNGCFTDFTCERFSVTGNKWEYIPSYQVVTNHKPINDFIGIIKY
ncbi:kelch motif family protein [Stylonychia lemnae]|uniref:Kelch motif family protein n=1 Tax=Stylonychia lemnae TaxID=5949 RepID=A0A077ZQN7_STYLE|nr:kelch motif family protein [Stylonychia lemnae]|eukprot:CDW72222.1 kelch motif family protein [Stylonychia lemnae]